MVDTHDQSLTHEKVCIESANCTHGTGPSPYSEVVKRCRHWPDISDNQVPHPEDYTTDASQLLLAQVKHESRMMLLAHYHDTGAIIVDNNCV